jgi:cyclic beta-1,2-glucan synthetase
MQKLASDHILKSKSDKDTYPIPRLKENYNYIYMVFKLLNEHLKINIPIHPAGEWILDNFYIVEKTVKTIVKELTLKKYINFIGIANGANKGFARVYVLASEIVSYTDARIDDTSLKDLLKAYQTKKTLNMDEIWNIGLFLQIALIENIRNVCERIYSAQLQKYKVENIIERLVENKEEDKLKYKNLPSYKTRNLGYGEMKYPFIEYMSYRLKSYGRQAYRYLAVLENQVQLMGSTIEDVIKKEHFDIAVRKVSVGNSIISINKLIRINFLQIFEEINGVEEILKKDPAGVYDNMDYKTKINYRNHIKEISKKTKISEIYIAKKCLELCVKNEENNKKTNASNLNNNIKINNKKKSHVGYYLIDKGKSELLFNLTGRKTNEISKNKMVKIYINTILIITILISLCSSKFIYNQTKNIWISGLLFLVLLIPIQTIVVQVIQRVAGKIVKPRPLPKLEITNAIPEQYSCMVIIPTIIKSKDKLEELMKKMEVYYLANKSQNIYFSLLGDCSTSKSEKEKFDDEIIKRGKELVEELNSKYPDEKFHKFNFIYRKRVWIDSENSFLGWERKRGYIQQFNEYMLTRRKFDWQVNTIEDWLEKGNNKIIPIKYVITLDADTDLVLNSAFELIGAMGHILNTPILNTEKDLVIEGHALIQPRVGIGLVASRKSIFTKIFAGIGGTDSYTDAMSNFYQDNFDEGIFTGKGIYDLKIFSQILKDEIPENTVLSHDLLEGCYLRCGFASDIMLMDGYPTSYASFKTRLHRWIRGDTQILLWLKEKINNKKGEKKKNPLNILSRYKIFDNLLRSNMEASIILLLIFLTFLNYVKNIKIWPIVIVSFVSVLIPSILEILNRIISKKDGQKKQNTFTPIITNLQGSILRGILSLACLPDKAYFSVNAMCISLYRMFKSKKHLLEWTTSEEAEKKAKKDLISYYKSMFANIIFGVLAIFIGLGYLNNFKSITYFVIGILWLVAPFIMWNISKEIKQKKKVEELSKEEKDYLLDIGKRTWLFFKENINENTKFLPPDNFQESRKDKIAMRTSPTNISLGMLAVISAYDLKYEDLESTIKLLRKMLDTISSLQKWNGHLYNWYNLEDLSPLIPRYISSVDNGNFVGYLYVVKQFFYKINDNNKYENEIKQIDKLINDTDFTKLYDEKNRLFSIGFNIEENKLTDSYYDLLASEARQASYVAIAKKDIPPKSWYNLSRTLTTLNKYKGLISWSGTAFEYLMPNINIPKYEGSLLDESCKFMIMSQMEYAKKLNIPWGFSEAAFSLTDLNNNYQYKAFGIPWLGLKRGLEDEMVVASYGSILAINEKPKEVIENLKKLEAQGMYDKYGFFESIDYTPNRMRESKNCEPVKTYMAHHQGLILLSINNLFNDLILQKRFMQNPEMQSVEVLLEERMPENVIITKEEKEKVEKIKYKNYEVYLVRNYNKINEDLNRSNVISNEDYTIVMDQKGEGYSKYKDILINRFKLTKDVPQGIFFFIKNIKTKRIWTANYMNYLSKPDSYEISFSPDVNKITRQDGSIETKLITTISPKDPVEIRRIEFTNYGNEAQTIELTSFLEPVLSNKMQDYAHVAFNNLFLTFEFLEDTGTILVRRKNRNQNENDMYLAINLYTEDETIGELEYEIDKEKFFGRGNLGFPSLVQKSSPFTNRVRLTVDPIVAMKRTFCIKPEEKKWFDLIITVADNKECCMQNINKFLNEEKIKRSFELSRARVEAENRYLGLKAKEIEVYQKMLSYILFQNPLQEGYKKNINDEICSINRLWNYGISGDVPILLVKIANINDMHVIEECLKAYEYFRTKNVFIDFVIINEEENSYENYVKDGIERAILNRNMMFLRNKKAGIFVLNNLDENEINLLESRANLILDCHIGKIGLQLKDLEEEYLENRKSSNFEIQRQPGFEEYVSKDVIKQELKYYNEYGGFSR